MNDYLVYLPAALAFATVSFATLAIIFASEAARAIARRQRVLSRLKEVDDPGAAQQHQDIFRPGERVTGFAATISRFPGFSTTAMRLKQAGIKWSPFSFIILTLGTAVAIGSSAFLISKSPLIGLVFGFIAGMIPEATIRNRRRRRLRRFEEQFPEAIDLLGRAIRAGHPMSAGIRMVADEMKDPASSEFRQVFEEQRFGLPFEDALLGLTDRNDLVDVRIFATAVLIQREVGGNLAEVLDKIAQTVRSRFAVERQLRVYTAQGRMSGYVLAVLPIAICSAIFAIDPTYASMLFTEPVGRLMVVAAVIMQIIGYMWIRRIVNIEY